MGRFSQGITGGAKTPAGYNSFIVEIQSDVARTVRPKVFADTSHTDTRALLGMDWLGIASIRDIGSLILHLSL